MLFACERVPLPGASVQDYMEGPVDPPDPLQQKPSFATLLPLDARSLFVRIPPITSFLISTIIGGIHA